MNKKCCNIITEVISVHPRKITSSNTDILFQLLKESSNVLRDPVCNKFEDLKPRFRNDDLKRHIGILADYVSTLSINEISQKENTVRLLLNNSEFIGIDKKELLISKITNLILSTNQERIIILGLDMIEKLIDKQKISEDIISGLRALLSHQNGNIVERVNNIKEKYRIKNI